MMGLGRLNTSPLLISAVGVVVVGCAIAGAEIALATDVEKSTSTSKVVTRLLTPEQYGAVIHDIFGPQIRLGGRFDPGLRVNGLLELGTSQVSVSETSMEQYDNMAHTIAAQVVGPDQRRLMISCAPASPSAADDDCAREFLTEAGWLLFRRPMSEAEHDLYVRAAHVAAEDVKDFYQGLGIALAALLESPQFLFRQEISEPVPGRKEEYRLDAFSRASRLSFFLWNAGPDLLLLAATENGELDTPAGLARQVNRMIASPRLKNGVRAFFSDMLQLDGIDRLSKDAVVYPMFSAQVAENAREQTLKTIGDVLVTRGADFREIFTTPKTFLTQTLASIYRVPLPGDMPNGYPDQWKAYEFPEGDPRAGILMHVSFVALHSHPGRSSPTLRGKALREIMLCQKVPVPPGDVNFTLVQDTDSTVYRTARERLAAHANEPMCAGCHKITDPLGLALENFDGAGGYRTTENGAPIDTSGALADVKFTNGAELGQTVAGSPDAISCVVDRLSSYALGRVVAQDEAAWIAKLKQSFADSSYIFPELMRTIVMSPEFFRGAPPLQEASETTMLTAPLRSNRETQQ